MALVMRILDMGLITLSAEEVMNLSQDSMVYRKFYFEKLFRTENSLVELLTGRPTELVVTELMEDLVDSTWRIRTWPKETKRRITPKERLLACFDDEDENEELQKATIPTPGHHQMQKSITGLGTLADLTTAASKYWPQGNRGPIPEKVRYDKHLQAYPWGLPAFKLTLVLKEARREEIYFNVDMREYLRDLEVWYFEQNKKTKKSQLDLDLQKWPGAGYLVDTLKSFLETREDSDIEMK
ncbi:hypothetical protein BJX68DRAFT_260469 [Aspergillus pseudodeflectus]|uniref:Uncharacterized protein n=1 Tax=Aspergillus pseudodeflectus TaxID=176178 RepID=A0ABR4LDU4_9EURO